MRISKHYVIFSLFILSTYYDELMAADSPCGDWEPYKEEKCFKIFDKVGLQTFEDAEKTCKQQENSSRLISINSREEQEFLSYFLFKKNQVVDNVWIGAKYINNKYKWDDDSDLTFTNWAEGSPKNMTDYCTQMSSGVNSVGKWVDEVCKKNLVVCQKRQTWSLSRLQEILLEVKQNSIPIGFIYVQLPKEKSPNEIWSWMTWKDVTADYAGLFFRAEGGDAASFGQVQQDNSPRLINVFFGGENDPCDRRNNYTVEAIPKGARTHIPICPLQRIDLEISDGEVRPRNMAIRVWKRTG